MADAATPANDENDAPAPGGGALGGESGAGGPPADGRGMAARPAPERRPHGTPDGSPAATENAEPAGPAATESVGPEAPPADNPAAGGAPAASEGPARPSRPAASGAESSAPPRPAARPAARAQPPAEPPPPDPVALEHPISKALAPLAPNLAPRIIHGYLELTVPAASLLAVAQLLRGQFDFDYLSQVTAVDWPDRFELVYTLYHLRNWRVHTVVEPTTPRGVIVRVNLPRGEEPRVTSLVSVWPGADLQERETYDMMGIRFLGHPDLRRILLDDDFPGFPLRKDFTIDPEYVLVRELARGVDQQLGRIDAGDQPA